MALQMKVRASVKEAVVALMVARVVDLVAVVLVVVEDSAEDRDNRMTKNEIREI